MSEIKLPFSLPQMRWAIFGRHYTQAYFIEKLQALSCPPPVVITSLPEVYARDKEQLAPHGLFSDVEAMAEAGKIIHYAIEDANSQECQEILQKHACNMGFSTSCRNIIRKPLIDFFEGRIFNLHGAYLPRERGGALNTWRILNGEHRAGCTIHVVDEGIDSGDIVCRIQEEVGKDFPVPLDFDFSYFRISRPLFDRFIELLRKDIILTQPQDERESLYLPRLYTEINGAIDLDWTVENIERFIRAFADPFPGAFTYLKDSKIHIHDAKIIAGEKFHPYLNGKVVTSMSDGSINLIAGSGLLNIREVTMDGIRQPAAKVLKIKQTLQTSQAVLAGAKTVIPNVFKLPKVN